MFERQNTDFKNKKKGLLAAADGMWLRAPQTNIRALVNT
jgi:hypothetical protein